MVVSYIRCLSYFTRFFTFCTKNVKIFPNSSEHKRNEKTDYANLFAIGWIFISEYSERLQEKGELTHV